MGKMNYGVYKPKASPVTKLRLAGKVRAKAAEIAEKSAEARRQARKKIYAFHKIV